MTQQSWTFARVARGIGRRVPLQPLRFLFPFTVWRPLFRLWLGTIRSQHDHSKAMRQLLEVYDDAYAGVDLGAIDYDGGVHAKHRLTGYHDFFVERIRQGERVLDVGCGKGELAYDIAERAGAVVVAVDASPWMLQFARERFAHPRITYVQADALEFVPEEPVQVAVLSNVLEHIEQRVDCCARSENAPVRAGSSFASPSWIETGPCRCAERSGSRTFPIPSTRSSTTRSFFGTSSRPRGGRWASPRSSGARSGWRR